MLIIIILFHMVCVVSGLHWGSTSDHFASRCIYIYEIYIYLFLILGLLWLLSVLERNYLPDMYFEKSFLPINGLTFGSLSGAFVTTKVFICFDI